MSTSTRLLTHERRDLTADSFLLTAAAGAAVTGLTSLLVEELGDPGWASPASAALLLAVVLVCPWVAWRLHGRRGALSGVAGAAIGIVVGGGAVWLIALVVGSVSRVVSSLTGDRVSVGWVAFAIVTGLLLALVVALDVDAVSDLRRRHGHVGTDVGRLAATGVGAVTAAVALWYAATHPGQEPGELLGFGAAAGVVGAAVALATDVVARGVVPRGAPAS